MKPEDLPAAAKLAPQCVEYDQIVMLKDGRVEKRGTREEVLPQLMGTSSAVSECHGVSGKECAQ